MKFREETIIACDTRINFGSLAKIIYVSDRVLKISNRTLISSTG